MSLGTIYQLLSCPSVFRVKRQLSLFIVEGDDRSTIDSFDQAMVSLSAAFQEAKESLKLLTTLEQHFKNLSQGELRVIMDNAPSLMNGLRLVWIISKRFKEGGKMKALLTLVTEEIASHVEEQLRPQSLFRLSS